MARSSKSDGRMGASLSGVKRSSCGKDISSYFTAPSGFSATLGTLYGGGAVGAYFATHGWDVEASDAERYVVALLREATINSPLRDPVKSARIYRWVTREEFFAAVKRPESLGLPDWEIGFIRIFWSFGNSQTSYLYGKHLEPIKKAGTNLIVLQEPQPFLNDIFPVSQQEKIADLPTVFAR
mgnify:CR=1 FL=1